MTVLPPDAQLAVDLVTKAGGLALAMRADGLRGTQKTSVSDVVTAADHAAEELVRTTLQRLRPDDGILGEEGTDAVGTSGRTWVIDPVDGTYNFLQGSPYWCSAIALRDDAAPDPAGLDPEVILGVVYQPQTGSVWVGGRDLPTTLNGEPVKIAPDLAAGMLSLGTYLHPGSYFDPVVMDPWRRAADQAATVRMLGSGSIDLASVAMGRLGLWAQLSCPQWDWLPGKALVRAAGGTTQVVRQGERDGQPLYWFLAGPPTAVEQTAAALRGDDAADVS